MTKKYKNNKFQGSVKPNGQTKWQGVHELKEKKTRGKPLQYEWKTHWKDGDEGGISDSKNVAPAEHPDVMNNEKNN